MTVVGLNMRALSTCLFTASLCALLSACGDDGSSTSGAGMMITTHTSVSDGIAAAVDVVAAPGHGANGLSPGSGKGTVIDGWEVEYQRLLITIGDVYFTQPDNSEVIGAGGFVLDLKLADTAHIATLDLPRGVSELGFSIPNAVDLVPHEKYATAEDAELMNKGGYSLYVEGSMTKKNGQSCLPEDPTDCVDTQQITFRWGLSAGAAYSGCKKSGAATSGDITVALTIPAVHWLLNSFETDPAALPLRAQWIADADLDRDGETTLDELTMIKASTLLTAARDYDLSRAPAGLDTVHDFLLAQARAIGQRAWGSCNTPTPL